MVTGPVSVIFISLLLINAVLIAAVMLLALIIGGRRLVNQRFAMVLFTYLTGSGLATVIWPFQQSTAIVLAPIRPMSLRVLGATMCLSSYLLVLFTEALFRTGPLKRWFRNTLEGSAVIVSLLFIIQPAFLGSLVEPFSTSPNLLDVVPLYTLVIGYVLVCNTAVVIMWWRNRDHQISRLFVGGLMAFVVSQALIVIPGATRIGLAYVLGTTGAIMIITALGQMQVLNPLAAQRMQIATERDSLLTANHIISEMLDAPDLESRLSILVNALNKFTGQPAYVILKSEMAINDPLTGAPITKPTMRSLFGYPIPSVSETMTQLQQLLDRWSRFDPMVLDIRRDGVGYTFPANDPQLPAGMRMPEASFIIPLHLRAEKLIGLIVMHRISSAPLSDAEQRMLTILSAQTRSMIENKQFLDEFQVLTDELQHQIEELVMMQHVDEELSATLNFDNVMMLTMDWALRRTGATAGMLNIITQDGKGMYPIASLGYELADVKFTADQPMPINYGIAGRAALTGKLQVVGDVSKDPDYVKLIDSTRSEVAAPLEMRGRVLGVLNLESDNPQGFTDDHLSFMLRLARRATIAMDSARLYREAERRADEMAALYSAGRSISSSLEHNDVLFHSAQALAAVLNVSSAVFMDYRRDKNELVVAMMYRLGTIRNAAESLLPTGYRFDLAELPELAAVITSQNVVVVQEIDSANSATWREVFKALNCKSIVVVPLIVQDQVTGVAIAIESRTPRLFSQDDLLLVESLISQAASALRQAALYEDVRELEKIKSEMIRMASHDLRNPLGNAMAYFELLLTTLNGTLSARQMEFAGYIKSSTRAMHELIDDLLTLERVESERQASWKVFNFTDLVEATFSAQKPNAELKQQFLKLDMKLDAKLSGEMFIYGSTTQLRQAVANLVSNAIKYTPDSGNINVKLWTEQALLKFEVQDTGYGISKERQARLFQRFYRAREATTDHIPGTGLGLSLVKTVIERHGGQVWVESELGVGSKFGFWLPLSAPEEPVSEKDVQHGTLED